MSETLSKIEQIKKLEYAIVGVQKHKDLIAKITSGYLMLNNTLPPVCCRVNPQYSNYMALDVQYLPMTETEFWDGYRENIDMRINQLQEELNDLLK